MGIRPSDETKKSWKDGGGCGFRFCVYNLDTGFNFWRKLSFFYHGFVCKVVPSLILCVVSFRLILTLIEAKNNRRKLTRGLKGGRCNSDTTITTSSGGTTNHNVHQSHHSSATFMPMETEISMLGSMTIIEETSQIDRPSKKMSPPSLFPPGKNETGGGGDNIKTNQIMVDQNGRHSHHRFHYDDESHQSTKEMTTATNRNEEDKMDTKKDGGMVEDRITCMLIVMLLLFLVTELPPGLVYVASSILGPKFFFECRFVIYFHSLTMYFLSGASNFLIFLTMSRQYRETLFQIFGFKKTA